MDQYKAIADSIRAIARQGDKPTPVLIPATVKEISKFSDSCTVTLDSGLELTNIRLKSTINGETEVADKLLVIPAEGSQVLLATLSGDYRDLAVVKVDKVKKITYTQGDLSLNIDPASTTIVYKAAEDKKDTKAEKAGGAEETGETKKPERADELKICIDAATQRISIANKGVSLLELFTEIAKLFRSYIAHTPIGITAGPTTVTGNAITTLQTKIDTLLME